MPNLDDIIKQHTEPLGTLEAFLEGIPNDDRQKIDQLIQDPNWSHQAVANVIADYSAGHIGDAESVRHHRRKTLPALFGRIEAR